MRAGSPSAAGCTCARKSIAHAVDRRADWEAGDATIVEASVTYTRKDQGVVTVPVVTIYRAGDERVDDYRIFIELAPVFAAGS